MKKIVALLLLLVMVFGAVSCGDKVEPPEGFQLASVKSAPFYLYVPNTWTSNASSGISSAYCSAAGSALVSAFSQKDDNDRSLVDYTAETFASFQSSLEGFELIKTFEETTLGSYAAYRFDYKAMSGKKETVFRTYVSEYAEGFVVLTYSAETSAFETYEPDFNEIVAKFTFKVANENPPTTDKMPVVEPIDGWQLASPTKYEYSFFVPKSWTVDKDAEIPTAYRSLDAGDRSNVTLMSYVLTEPMTAKEYWALTESELVFDHTVISTDENATLGGLSAFAVEYDTGLTGMMYRVKQVFCATSNMVYVFTFTSDATYYEQHLPAVNEMLRMFTFD
ncbi:MAG: hypothetical protein IJW69_04795 [Clostridia bacterium]|nr:hypothetical protein [Clostridia bacterium]